MISAQCDELRSMAASVGLEVPQAATLMMEAADTIDRLDAENAELREQGARLFDKVLELGIENAKLKDTGRALLQCVRKLNTAVTCEGAGCPVRDDCDLHRLINNPRIEVDE